MEAQRVVESLRTNTLLIFEEEHYKTHVSNLSYCLKIDFHNHGITMIVLGSCSVSSTMFANFVAAIKGLTECVVISNNYLTNQMLFMFVCFL